MALIRWHLTAQYGPMVLRDAGLATSRERAEEYARRRYCRADSLTITCRALAPHPVQEPLHRLLMQERMARGAGECS